MSDDNIPEKKTQGKSYVIQKSSAAIVTKENGEIVLVFPDREPQMEHVLLAAVYDRLNMDANFLDDCMKYFVDNPERSAIYGIASLQRKQ